MALLQRHHQIGRVEFAIQVPVTLVERGAVVDAVQRICSTAGPVLELSAVRAENDTEPKKRILNPGIPAESHDGHRGSAPAAIHARDDPFGEKVHLPRIDPGWLTPDEDHGNLA